MAKSIRRSYTRKKSYKRKISVRNWAGFKEYMHNGMNNKSFTNLPRSKKVQIVKEAIKAVKHPRAKKNMKSDLKYLLSKRSRRSYKFGTP
jgi:hypothetical protein